MTRTTQDSVLARITQMRLKYKLPLIIASAALISGLAVTYYAVETLTSSYEKSASNIMQNKLQEKEAGLEALMSDIIGDLHAIADNPYTISATKDFTAAYNELGKNPTRYLQQNYITDNQNKVGEKHLLDAADDGSVYSQTHAQYHPYFREFTLENGYYDLFIVDARGNVVYTMYK